MISRKIKKALGFQNQDENGDCVFVVTINKYGTVDTSSYSTFPDALDGVLEDFAGIETIPTVAVFRDIFGNPQGSIVRDAFNPEISHLCLADGVVRHFRSFLVTDDLGVANAWTYPVDLRGTSLGKAKRLGNPLEPRRPHN